MIFKKNKAQKEIENDLKELVSFSDSREKEKFDQEAFQLDIMNEVRRLMVQNGWNQNDLAIRLGKSKSYISQLFSVDKLINIKTIIKLQNIFNVKFILTSSSHEITYLKKYAEIKKNIDTFVYHFSEELNNFNYYANISLIKHHTNKPITSNLMFVSKEGSLCTKSSTKMETKEDVY